MDWGGLRLHLKEAESSELRNQTCRHSRVDQSIEEAPVCNHRTPDGDLLPAEEAGVTLSSAITFDENESKAVNLHKGKLQSIRPPVHPPGQSSAVLHMHVMTCMWRDGNDRHCSLTFFQSPSLLRMNATSQCKSWSVADSTTAYLPWGSVLGSIQAEPCQKEPSEERTRQEPIFLFDSGVKQRGEVKPSCACCVRIVRVF